MTTKHDLRRRILAARAARDPVVVRAAGESLAERLLASWGSARSVACYLSVGTEPRTWEAVSAFGSRGAEVLAPVVLDEGGLGWAPYEGPDRVRTNRVGVVEPTSHRVGADALATADLVVLPGLAADHAGHRLGRGGGYYDRALAGLPATVPRVVLVYDDEVLPEVPVEAHDQPVDAAVTPGRTWTFPVPPPASHP